MILARLPLGGVNNAFDTMRRGTARHDRLRV